MKEYAKIEIVDDTCKHIKCVKGVVSTKSEWTKAQHDKIVRNLDTVETPADCCKLELDSVHSGTEIHHKDGKVYKVHAMLLSVSPQNRTWAPRFRCQPNVDWEDCKSCAEMMATGKCVDKRMREIVGAVLYPHLYGKLK